MEFAAHQLHQKCIRRHRDLSRILLTWLRLSIQSVGIDSGKYWKSSDAKHMYRHFPTTHCEPSEAFPVCKEVKQDCPMAPALFGMMFFEFDIRIGIDGKLFKLRRFQVVTKVREAVLRYFLFALPNKSIKPPTEIESWSSSFTRNDKQ